MTGVQTCALPICFPVTIMRLHQGAARNYSHAMYDQVDLAETAEKFNRKDLAAIHRQNAGELSKKALHHQQKSDALAEDIRKAKEAEQAKQKQLTPPPTPVQDSDAETMRMYTQSGGTYQQVNSGLRNGGELDETSRKTIKLLDEKFDTEATPITAPLYRGLSGFDPSDVGLTVGAEFKDAGFTSTSGDEKVAKKFATFSDSGKLEGEYAVGTLFKIVGSKGSKALNMNPYSRYNENEFLLPRGSRFKVTSIKQGVPGKSLSKVSLKIVTDSSTTEDKLQVE